jgi:Domain of unknown function (DUF4396)
MNAFSFLTDPAFVITWYAFGIVAALWVVFDAYRVNRPLMPAMKWAWPIIVVFFSVIGVALYVVTSRPPGIGKLQGEEQKRRFKEYVDSTYKKVTGSVIHCVGGDGLGIITAMVVSRLLGLSFWQEFWFEYAVGFAFGWFIFQYKAMSMMTDSTAKALWMGGRAEFFSMITVMGGMGAVMGYVTPLVAGEQPKPDTFAFWGFSALGLLVGFIVTYPMNWVLVKMKWKHGM